MGPCGLNLTRNIIPSTADFDIYIYILGLRLIGSCVCVENS